ncbi:MAG: SDR family oxidoreductase [Burkholderiales bacterium]|nr:SDR family oxidoreductase [Burkholderiales bacterium]
MKTALITGGTRGIGLAISRRLSQEGWQLALTYRSDEAAARRLSDELSQQGTAHVMLRADTADPQQMRALPRQVLDRFGRFDALVNNAGIVDDGAFLTMEPSRIARLLKTNLFGAMHLTLAALPALRQGHHPAIVMMSSLGGVIGKEGQVAYAASKGGLIGFAQWLGAACHADGIQVNAIAPGFIGSSMTDDLRPSMVDHILQGSALGRPGEAPEVAAAVSFLLQPGYVQSSTLRLDGGFNR